MFLLKVELFFSVRRGFQTELGGFYLPEKIYNNQVLEQMAEQIKKQFILTNEEISVLLKC